MITTEQLTKAVGCTVDRAAKWYPHLVKAMQHFQIISINEMASFISQLAHESGHLSRMEENLNYSADSLARVWPGRYRDPVTKKPNRLALILHRKPVAIANNCYANRMGNGDEKSGDGYRYRGRGPIQITGRENYLRCGQALGVDLVNNPDLLLQPEHGAMSAGWYWQKTGLDKHDDDESALAETKLINGGTTGIDDRERLLKLALIEFSQGA